MTIVNKTLIMITMIIIIATTVTTTVDEPGQLVRRAVRGLLGGLRLRHELVDLGDVLAHADDPDDVALALLYSILLYYDMICYTIIHYINYSFI